MRQPSTEWQERVTSDEDSRFSRYVDAFTIMQRTRSQRFGNGRALHRKQLLAVRAELDIAGDIPEHARYGLFAAPGKHDAVIRMSSASMDVHPDRVSDIRGFAVKVRGVSGAGALGGQTSEQDFVTINLPTFRLPNSALFAGVVIARSKGDGAVVRFLLKTYGPFRFLRQARHGIESLKWPFTGFTSEPFHSAAPIACGPYAVRVRFDPQDRHAEPDARNDWAAAVRSRLSRGAVVFDVQLQFFVDEAITPIEDASVDWPQIESPYVTVGTLTIPPQETTGQGAETFAAEVENMSFDPWHALAEHRPLGEVMRARKALYIASVTERGAAPVVSAAG